MSTNSWNYIFACLSLAMLSSSTTLFAQSHRPATTLSGTVYETQNGKLVPLRLATIFIAQTGATATTNSDGEFEITNIPTGKIKLLANFVGKVGIDTLINMQGNTRIKLQFKENNFRLDQVEVTAKSSGRSQGTGSLIGRTAIEHLQASSLADIMSLVPGGLTSNPDLTNAKQLTIRGIAKSDPGIASKNNANAFGTSIVINGSPVSNNANMQVLNPVTAGGNAAMGGGAAPATGFDVRSIPVENIESIEVIRGVPSVEYGDVSSGMVIVNQKAGKQDLSVNANTNPNLYSLSASKGFELGNNNGALNIGADYSHNLTNPIQAYNYYERTTFNTLYSNTFFKNRLSTTSGLNIGIGKDTRKQNPDDEILKTKSSGEQLSFNFTTSGTLRFNEKWLQTIKYSGNIGYMHKASFFQEQHSSATAPYSMTYTDGAVLSNFPGKTFYDKDNNPITNIPAGQEALYALSLPSTYIGAYNIDGKEFTGYAKAVASFYNSIGNSQHRWMIGADVKYDKNYGHGKTFADSLPPMRSAVYSNATFRKRKFSDIPGLSQVGLFAEENFSAAIGEHNINILAGLRYDRYTGGKSAFSPRVNVFLDAIPRILTLRAGYGMLAKAPGIMYLSPENAYFEYININELASSSIPVDERVFMTTTHNYSTVNPDLKIAKNEKKEIGFDLNIGKTQLRVTGFDEKLKDGYAIGTTVNSFAPSQYIEYKRVKSTEPIYAVSASNPVLSKFQMPNNSYRQDKKGVELELDFPRIDAIRTQFSLYGAHIQQKTYSSDYFFYDGQSGSGGASRTHIGLYQPEMTVDNDKSTVTTLKTTHNIPSIGFVVTLTTEVIWNESDWKTYGNDSIPSHYISKLDGQVYDFDVARKDEAEFKTLLRPHTRTEEIVESLPPMINFNLNITKEIKDIVRISFFANNAFRSYPVAQSDRINSEYYKRNLPFYFGFNVGLKIK